MIVEPRIALETTIVTTKVFVMVTLTLPSVQTATLDGWDQHVVTPVYMAHLTPQDWSVTATRPAIMGGVVTLSAQVTASVTVMGRGPASVIHWLDGVAYSVKSQAVLDIPRLTSSVLVTETVIASP